MFEQWRGEILGGFATGFLGREILSGGGRGFFGWILGGDLGDFWMECLCFSNYFLCDFLIVFGTTV